MSSVTAPVAVPAREKHEPGNGRLAVLKVAVKNVNGNAAHGCGGRPDWLRIARHWDLAMQLARSLCRQGECKGRVVGGEDCRIGRQFATAMTSRAKGVGQNEIC